MTTIDFMSSLPGEVAEGKPATAEGASHAFRSMEDLFQGGFHGNGQNIASGGALRGRSFRKNGLTEVFKRSSSSDFWVGGGNSTKRSFTRIYDIPGSALRFRLRAPADVIVFFSATIHRFNRPDLVYRGTAGMGDYASDIYGPHGVRRCPQSHFLFKVQAFWEAEDAEPGGEYEQARSVLKGWGALRNEMIEQSGDSPLTGGHHGDMSRGIFLPWRIRSLETADPDWREFQGEPLPQDFSDTRIVSGAPTSVAGGTPANHGRLQAGWHNIRHTITDMATTSDAAVRRGEDEYVDDHSRQTLRGLVFANTEVVVVANYAPRSDESATTLSGTAIDQSIQDKKATEKGFGIVSKANADFSRL